MKKSNLRKTQKERKSLRSAINAFCKYCIYDPGADGTWRKQVEDCTATDCPLHPVRPTSIGITKEKEE